MLTPITVAQPLKNSKNTPYNPLLRGFLVSLTPTIFDSLANAKRVTKNAITPYNEVRLNSYLSYKKHRIRYI